jgi:hypothetical protein
MVVQQQWAATMVLDMVALQVELVMGELEAMGVEEQLVVGDLVVLLGGGEVLGEVEELDMAMQEVQQGMVLLLLLVAWVGMGMFLGVQVVLVLVKPLEAVQPIVELAMAMGTVRVAMGPL